MAAPERPTNRRYLVLLVLCSLGFIVYVDRLCLAKTKDQIVAACRWEELGEAEQRAAVAAAEAKAAKDGTPVPTRAAALAAAAKAKGDRYYSYMLFAFFLGYTFFEVPGGWLGDRFGPRFAVVRVVAMWSMFTALTGAADWLVKAFVANPTPFVFMATMFATRFLFGVGEAGAYPNISRILSRWFPLRDRARVQGTIWLASRWGGAASPFLVLGVVRLAESLGFTAGWRIAFWTFGIVGVAWAFWFLWWFRDRPENSPGVNQAEIALIRGDEPASGTIYDDHGHRGATLKAMATSANTLALFFVAFVASFAWYFVNWMPGYLKDRFGVGDGHPHQALMLALPTLAGGFCCLLGGAYSDALMRWTHSRRLSRMLPGLTAFAGAGACFLAAGHQTNVWSAVFFLTCAYGFNDLHMASLWSIPADIAGRRAGTLAGMMNMLGNFGGTTSSLLTPRLIEGGNYGPLFLMNASIYFVGALAWLRINAEERLPVEGTS